jgi:transcription initiation factor IIE alpha subunit
VSGKEPKRFNCEHKHIEPLGDTTSPCACIECGSHVGYHESIKIIRALRARIEVLERFLYVDR